MKIINKVLNYKFVSDSIYSFISFVILALSGIIINVIIGNKYGPEGLGVFSQAISLYMIFSLLANFGLNISTLKYVAEHKLENDKIKLIFSSAIILSLLISSLVLIVLYLLTILDFSIFFNYDVTKATLIICLSLPIFSVNKIFMALANGLRQIKTVSILQSIRWISIIIQLIFYIYSDFEFNDILKMENIETLHGISIGSILSVVLCLNYDWDDLDTYFVERPWHKSINSDIYTLFNSIQTCGIYDRKFFNTLLGIGPLANCIWLIPSIAVTGNLCFAATGSVFKLIWFAEEML